MEDEIEVALIWDNALEMTLHERLDRLNGAGKSISSLAEAAKVVMRLGEA